MPSRSRTESSANDDAHGQLRAHRWCRRSAGSRREPAVERRDAVGEAAQARAACGIGAADAVVGDLDHDAAVVARDARRRPPTRRACLTTFVSASATT